MSARLLQLLAASFLFFCVGVAIYPVLYPTPVEKPEEVVTTQTPVIRDTQVDDWTHEDEAKEDAAWEEEPADEPVDEKRGIVQDSDSFTEDDVPLDPKQNVVPEARKNAGFTTAMAGMRRYADMLEKQDAQDFKSDEFKAVDWERPDLLYNKLAERVVQKLGKLEDADII